MIGRRFFLYKLEGKNLRFMIDGCGRCASFYNKLTCHEYVLNPGYMWKIIYAMPGTERVEVPIWAENQKFTAEAGEGEITLVYDGLIGDEEKKIDAKLTLHFIMADQGLRVTSELENRDSSVALMELQLTPLSGARSLSGDPENDYIAWPRDLGTRVRNPAYRDISTYAGFRKYERHDQFHTDMDAIYQGGTSMQWYDWYNTEEGVYFGSEDTTRHAVGLHVERDVKLNVLRMGFIRYPMLKAGESWKGQAIDLYPHLGDWHAGAKIYRAFMDETGSFKAPDRPAWCQDFTGWLRVILKQHHCECNWTYDDIPALYDEVEAAGMNTLYLLGWEKGGFARMWPDFVVDDGRLGGREKLKQGIDYVHQKGGKVVMFLSYSLIDYQSNFYKKEGGDQCTVKSIWGQDVPFAETYCGEGTYRKIVNPPMPMYLACPGAPKWQEKMKEAARECLDLGADGVLYDLGGIRPYFCFAKNHTHKKPSEYLEHKAENYAGLREYVKSFGDDKIIMMENNVDIYGQYMDLAQGGGTFPDRRLRNPQTAEDLEGAKEDGRLLEMYRYTFPELVMTNRECGEDEVDYKAMAGYSFLLGLRFDMTIFRCCGSLSDIPNYAAYLKKINGIYHEFADYILRGKFVDTDGFTSSNPYVLAKGWQGVHGGMAATLWNPTGHDQEVTLKAEGGKEKTVTVPAEEVLAVRL